MTQDAPGTTQADAGTGTAVAARQIVALVAVAVVIGLFAGVGASLFLTAEHELQHWLWHSLPEALGQEKPAWWLVIGLLVTGAFIVHAASKLPGHGGHRPLQPFSMDIGARELVGVVLAALGSLSFGAVLGPEAPLIAIGTGLAALAIRKPGSPVQQVMMLTGAMAAVSAIFGNPLITAILLLEMAMLAGPAVASPPVLLAALTGMAASYTLQVGFEGWSGLGVAQLSLPGLDPYPTLQAIDLAVSVPLAVVIALLSIAARLGGLRVEAVARRRPLLAILACAVVVALIALAVATLVDGDVDLVLFSGQQAIPDYLALTSLGSALVIAVGKFLAYVASLGSGFRGGPIFPAIAVGTLLAMVSTLVIDGTSESALAATAIAAATAGSMRLPFTALMLGVMLTYPAGGATTVLAVVGTVIGMVARLAAEQRIPSLAPAAHEA